MKKSLLYLLTVLCTCSFFIACSDDDEPEKPPTVDKILATYSADKLTATVDGQQPGDNARVEIVEGADASAVNLKLYNMVNGQEEFTVSGVKFEAMTKSLYYSKLTGETTDNILGLKVAVDGTVDEGVLKLAVTTETFEGEPITDASVLFSTYKGQMNVAVSGLSETESSEQRVYVMKAKKDVNGNNDSKIKLQIKNFAFGGQEIGTISLDTIPVLRRGDVYAFKAADMPLSIRLSGQNLKVKVNLSGYILNGDLVLKLDIDANPLTVKVDFKGASVVEATTAAITKFEFVNGEAIVDTLTDNRKYYITLWDNTPAGKMLITPKLTLADGASITASVAYYNKQDNEINLDEAIDFSKFADGDYIKYSVQAQDPSFTAAYFIYVKLLKSITSAKYDFARLEWISNEQPAPFDYDEPAGWGTSNGAATFLKIIEAPNSTEEDTIYYYDQKLPFPISKTAEGYAKITTVDTKGGDMYFAVVPAVTAGTLFQGEFEVNLDNTLKSTKFGIPYDKKPLSFKMDYKYTPGQTYYKTIVEGTEPGARTVIKQEVPGTQDACSINAILYEVANYEETLDGTNINTSDKIVAVALLADGSAKVNFTACDIPFTYIKEYDPAKKYKLAVVCSSSAKGDSFEGAPGSELIVRSLEVVNE